MTSLANLKNSKISKNGIKKLRKEQLKPKDLAYQKINNAEIEKRNWFILNKNPFIFASATSNADSLLIIEVPSLIVNETNLNIDFNNINNINGEQMIKLLSQQDISIQELKQSLLRCN